MKDVLNLEERRKGAGCAKARIQKARECYEDIRKCIGSTLDREVHGWIWGLEQMAAEMESEGSASSDVKAWKKLIETYDALFELVQPRTS